MPAPAQAKTKKTDRLEARVSPEIKELCQQAADLEGRSLTDFVVQTVCDAAKRTILDHQIINLSTRDRAAMFEAFGNPPPPTEELIRAAHRYKELFGS